MTEDSMENKICLENHGMKISHLVYTVSYVLNLDT